MIKNFTAALGSDFTRGYYFENDGKVCCLVVNIKDEENINHGFISKLNASVFKNDFKNYLIDDIKAYLENYPEQYLLPLTDETYSKELVDKIADKIFKSLMKNSKDELQEIERKFAN